MDSHLPVFFRLDDVADRIDEVSWAFGQVADWFGEVTAVYRGLTEASRQLFCRYDRVTDWSCQLTSRSREVSSVYIIPNVADS